MPIRSNRNPIALLGLVIFSCSLWTVAQAQPSSTQVQTPPLTANQVVANLQEKNRERAQALYQFQGTRIYRMQYRGFPSDRDAEMVVKAAYQAPASKEFTVVSQTGSKFVIEHVFKKLLEGEQEAMDEENRKRTALDATNYDFTLDQYDVTPAGPEYVLSVLPKSKNKFLYSGKIWVDAKDFAVVRIEAEPAKNPSFWIKKSEIKHTYVKVDDFWLPAENHTESVIRLGGRAILSIEYKDYKITQAAPINRVQNAPANVRTSQVRELR
jgi:hypothetical protein